MTNVSQIAIQLKDVSKTFVISENHHSTLREWLLSLLSFKGGKKEICALRNINLTINKGEAVGIIGRNGSGKSTLIRIIMESILPDKMGKVLTQGRIIRLALGMGVDANLSARDNIYINGSVIGLSFKRIGELFDTIIEFAGLENFVDTPVKFYSKGMKQRLLFSIAMHAESDIFLLDEFFGGTGDANFRQKSIEAFKARIIEGKTLVIVTHSPKIVKTHCHRVIWLDKGEIIMIGKPESVLEAYAEFNGKSRKV